MTVEDMSQQMVAFVAMHDRISFTELVEACGSEARGDLTLELRPNLVLWSGVSQVFSDAFTLASHLIVVIPQKREVGVEPSGAALPIASSVRGYKEPHWLPTALRLRGRR